MRIRCAWHEKNFGFVKWIGEKPGDEKAITDGCCEECLDKIFSEPIPVSSMLNFKSAAKIWNILKRLIK